MNAQQILETTEVRRSNGQCEYGAWEPLEDQCEDLQEEVVGEILDAMCREVRKEPSTGNTTEYGEVNVNGRVWVYSR
jgi:hypothetical protein